MILKLRLAHLYSVLLILLFCHGAAYPLSKEEAIHQAKEIIKIFDPEITTETLSFEVKHGVLDLYNNPEDLWSISNNQLTVIINSNKDIVSYRSRKSSHEATPIEELEAKREKKAGRLYQIYKAEVEDQKHSISLIKTKINNYSYKPTPFGYETLESKSLNIRFHNKSDRISHVNIIRTNFEYEQPKVNLSYQAAWEIIYNNIEPEKEDLLGNTKPIYPTNFALERNDKNKKLYYHFTHHVNMGYQPYFVDCETGNIIKGMYMHATGAVPRSIQRKRKTKRFLEAFFNPQKSLIAIPIWVAIIFSIFHISKVIYRRKTGK